jgi:hypothetical protein
MIENAICDGLLCLCLHGSGAHTIGTLWTILTLISGSLQVEVSMGKDFTVHQLHNDATILEDETFSNDLLTVDVCYWTITDDHTIHQVFLNLNHRKIQMCKVHTTKNVSKSPPSQLLAFTNESIDFYFVLLLLPLHSRTQHHQHPHEEDLHEQSLHKVAQT